MNNNHRITLNTNKNIIVEFTNERIIPASGLAVVGTLLGKSDFIKKLNRMDVTSNRSQHQIKNGDIVLTYLGMLCMGKPYFEAFSLSSENFAEKARMTGLKWQSSIAGMLQSEPLISMVSSTLFPILKLKPGGQTLVTRMRKSSVCIMPMGNVSSFIVR